MRRQSLQSLRCYFETGVIALVAENLWPLNRILDVKTKQERPTLEESPQSWNVSSIDKNVLLEAPAKHC